MHDEVGRLPARFALFSQWYARQFGKIGGVAQHHRFRHRGAGGKIGKHAKTFQNAGGVG